MKMKNCETCNQREQNLRDNKEAISTIFLAVSLFCLFFSPLLVQFFGNYTVVVNFGFFLVIVFCLDYRESKVFRRRY